MTRPLLFLLIVSFTCSVLSQCPITGTDIEGPYYQPGAPIRVNDVCEASPALDRLVLTGYVLDSKCVPVQAQLDIWQANERGQYSEGNSHGSNDFTCRSMISTNANGAYNFTTIFPGRYDDGGYRPAHIHFKIYPVNKNLATITTQLYFKLDSYIYPKDSCARCNSRDPTLVAEVLHIKDIKTYVGKWNIVLAPATAPKTDIAISKHSVPEDGYSFKKPEIIAPNVHLVENLKKEIEALRKRI